MGGRGSPTTAVSSAQSGESEDEGYRSCWEEGSSLAGVQKRLFEEIVEALVKNDINQWIELLAVSPSKQASSHAHFDALNDDLWRALNCCVNVEAAQEICFAILRSYDVRAYVAARGVTLASDPAVKTT